MRVVACDDMQILADAFIREAKKCCEEYKKPGEVFEYYAFTRPSEMIASHERMPFDLAILDIAMPELDGFKCAELMRSYYPDIEIIFVTSHSEYLEESFDCGAFWFVEKELGWKELSKALIKLLSGERKAPYAALLKMHETDAKDIMYYTAARNKVISHFSGGRTKESYTTLKKIEEETTNCIRVNKSTAVNVYFVRKATKKNLILFNGEKINVAKGREKALEAYFTRYKINPEIFLASQNDEYADELPPAPSDVWE